MLALLEDSVRYQTDHSTSDPLDCRRDQGIDFVTALCNLWKGAAHWITTQSTGCTYNRKAEGYYPIVNHQLCTKLKIRDKLQLVGQPTVLDPF